MRRNKYAIVSAVLSSATPLLLGYDLVMVIGSAVLTDAPDMKLMVKILACIIVASCLLGAVAAVGAQCAIGDRQAVLLSTAALCAGALARGVATSFAAFAAGVFVNGVGMGMALVTVPAYAGELGGTACSLASYPDGFVCLGCILGALTYTTRFLNLPAHVAWRLTVSTGTAVPALLGLAVLLMPDSPRWPLVTKGDVTEARRVLERTEIRLFEVNTDHLGDGDDTVATPARQSRWREEREIWLDLLARPTEPLRRAIVTTVVTAFQQASGIGPVFLYAQHAFRHAGGMDAHMAAALVAFGFVVIAFSAMSLLLLELVWLLVKALAGCCCTRRAPSTSLHSYRGGVTGGMKWRREQMKWARSLSATMLLSTTALVWLALGPVHLADASARGCPRWMLAAMDAVNRAVRATILTTFMWVYEVNGSLPVCPVVIVFVCFFVCLCILGTRERP
uniref:Major facilitator superfamily (MFS) profile domain-containing protein n=1 Tax=Leersia perrieri TaxID=77586 RepID=A0A0D9X0U0_9ORYZ